MGCSEPSGPSSETALTPTKKRSAFQATRLTPSTFLVKEFNDIYSEHPHIYVKIAHSTNTVLVVDTGCGGASDDRDVQITSLREFIETVGVEANDGKPLNIEGRMNYIVVLTHCHYDHILGVEQFRDSLIIASSHNPSFLSLSVLPEHSLCKAMGIHTPSYAPTLVPHLHIILECVISVIHTPGHTPDELALYDPTEGMLYVGDSLYETEDIIFPKEGSIVTWLSSVEYLISFVRDEDEKRNELGEVGKVLINAGHCTALLPALELLEAAKSFMHDVVDGREVIKKQLTVRGEKNVTYRQEGGRFSLRCPERLVLEAREKRLM